MRVQSLIAAAIILIAGAVPASAGVIGFDFTGSFYSGSMIGQGISGTITYDDTQVPSSTSLTPGFANMYYYFDSFSGSNFSGPAGFAPGLGNNKFITQDSLIPAVADAYTFGEANSTFSYSINFTDVYTQIGDGAMPTLAELAGMSGKYIVAYDPTGGFSYASFAISPAAAAVPEPLTMSVFGAGLIGAAAMRRRRQFMDQPSILRRGY